MARTFRRGAVGAMMDEYERAAGELVSLVAKLTDDDYAAVRDTRTPDENCRSIQTVCNHVVRSGYAYADYIRGAFGDTVSRPDVPLAPRAEVAGQVAAMLAYTAATLEGRWLLSEKEIMEVEIHSRWGQDYDLEQLLEHAIVHVLRHRRQIERFLTDPEFAAV